jgi:hypothetical protein
MPGLDDVRRLLSRYTPSRRRDPHLWSSLSEFRPSWSERIERMARFIDRPGKVADFGCGPMWLERCLRSGNTYVPLDCMRRDERTIVVDLNTDPIPELDAQIAFMSGVLEYIQDLPAIVRQLENQDFSRLIISYNTLEEVPDLLARRKLNWVSHLYLAEVVQLFTATFALVESDSYTTNTILVFDRQPRTQPSLGQGQEIAAPDAVSQAASPSAKCPETSLGAADVGYPRGARQICSATDMGARRS